MSTTTIAAGASKQLRLAPYTTLTLAGTGSVEISRAGKQRQQSIGGFRVYGPFREPSLLFVQATTTVIAVKYEAESVVGKLIVVTESRDANAGDNGNTLVFAGAYTVTLLEGMPENYGFAAKPPASGNASIARATGVLLNGGSSTLTRALASNVLFAVSQDAPNSYSVTGS